MAPDKIFVEIRHPFGNEFTEMVGFENKGNSEDIEYIRKDALLEWVYKRLEEFRYIAEISNDVEADGEVDAFEELIDKLNSM